METGNAAGPKPMECADGAARFFRLLLVVLVSLDKALDGMVAEN